MIAVVACFRTETMWVKKTAGMRVVRIPMGARAGFDRILPGRSSLHLIVSTGFCGGLEPRLKTGDLILATEIIYQGKVIRIAPALINRARDALAQVDTRLASGPVLTADRVAATKPEKARMYKETNAVGVEMEAGPLADWAEEHSIPLLAVKSVLDPAERGLPVQRAGEAALHPIAAVREGLAALRAGRAIGRGIGAIVREFGGAE